MTSAGSESISTLYAACESSSSRKFANFINDTSIIGTDATNVAVSYPASAYECCVSLLVNPTGKFWFWGFEICYVGVGEGCAAENGGEVVEPAVVYIQEGVRPMFTTGGVLRRVERL